MKRLIALSAAVVMTITACSGTGSGGPATPQPQSQAPTASGDGQASPDGAASGPVTLTLLEGVSEDPEIEQLLNDRVEEFNASQDNITVKRESLQTEQIRTVIQTRLSSGSIDLFGYDTGPGFGGVLAKAGLLADMGPGYEQYGWEIFDWASSRCTYAGVVSCIPEQVEEVGIFYNKTMFDEKGYQPPTTLEEFQSIMDGFKADGVTPLAFGNQEQWPAGHQFSMTLSNLVGREGLDARLYGDAPWNDEAGVKAIDIYFKQFADAGYFPRDPNAVTYDDANAVFYSGQAAMVPTGTWLVAEITNNTDFETGFFPFPSIEGSDVAPPAGIGRGLFVNNASKNKEGAFEYINWLLQPEQIKKWDLGTFNAIPALPIDTAGVEVSPLFGVVLQNLAETSGETADFGYNIDVLTPANFNDQMFTGFQEVLGGQLTPQQQADALQEEYQKALEAGDTIPKP